MALHINTVSAAIGNTNFGNTTQVDRKPILRKLPGIHVSEGPLCKDTKIPMSHAPSFYQHLFSLPTSVQTYLQQILAAFKLKKKLDLDALTGIRAVLLSHFKEESLSELKGRRRALLAHYVAILNKQSKRSHPHDLMSFLIGLCTKKKPATPTPVNHDLISQQLKEIDQALRLIH